MSDNPKAPPKNTKEKKRAEQSKYVRDKIQAQIDRAKEEHKRELMRHRIDIAKQGLRAFDEGKLAEAAKALSTYILLIEEWKKVSPGQLMPTHFELPKDSPELLLISGVYWDLAKITDFARTKYKKDELDFYLHKFIIFTKGLPHESVAAETLRKFIQTDKPKHKAEFRGAYKAITGSNCFVATSLIDHIEVESIDLLRRYRDERLSQSLLGRVFTRIYYRVGPALAWGMDRMPEPVRKACAKVIEAFSRKI